MDLASVLAGISGPALTDMSRQLEQRALTLANGDSGDAAWSRLYGLLSIEMDTAALRQATGVTI